MSEPGGRKKRFKKIFMAMTIFLAVLLVGLGGALLWLRSAAGGRFVFDKAASVLAKSGFELSAAEIAGPLPGRLLLRGVKFFDKDGLIAALDEAELRLRLSDLFDKVLRVERLALTNPELFRLPTLEKSADEEPPAAVALPFDVRLDELAVNGALIHGGIVPGGPESPNLAFALNGIGQLQKGESLEQLPLAFGLNLEILDVAALNQDIAGPLKLNIKADGTVADFLLSADLASAGLNTPGGLLENLGLQLNLAGQVMKAQAAAPELIGDVLITTSSSPAGPLNLSAQWFFESEGGLWVQVRKLQGSLGALNFAGGLIADLRGEKPALDGSLSMENADWSLASQLGQPLSGGPAKLSLQLASENAKQSLTADLDLPDLRLAGAAGEGDIVSLSQTRAAIAASDIFGQLDLEADISLGPGRAASAQWNDARLKASGHTGNGVFSAELGGLGLQGFGATERDSLKLAGAYDLNEKSADINQLELMLAASGLRLNSPVRVGLGEALSLSPVSLTILPGGSLSAELDLRPEVLKVKADLAALPFTFLKPFLGPETFVPDGMLDSLTVNLRQGSEGISGTADLAASVRYQGLSPAVKLRGDLSGGPRPALALSGHISGGPGWEAGGDINAAVPLKAEPGGSFPQPDMAAPLSAALDFSGPIEPLWKLAKQPDRFLRGILAVKARVDGTLTKPEPQGSLYLAGGHFEDALLGLLLRDINLEAHSTPAALLSATAEAKDSRGGGLALKASLQQTSGGGGLEMAARGQLGRFNPLQRDDISLYLSGDIAAQGPVERPVFTSNITVDRGELNLKALMAAQSIPTLTIAEGSEALSADRGPRLNLNVRVPNQFFIRGYGLDSEWQGEVTVSGFAARPSLAGRLAPVRGYFEIFSREFQFTGGDITFNGGVDPNLNLELTNNAPGVTAIISIGGRGTSPRLGLSSRPPQPQEEVLAQVLFGKKASSLSRFEALQLAAGLRELTSFGEEGAFSFDPLSRMREELGLDVLRVGGADGESGRAISDASGSLAGDMKGGAAAADESVGGSTLEAGKYINDKVYVGVEHASSGASAFRVEMELSPLMSLEARSSTESSQIGVGWKKDY